MYLLQASGDNFLVLLMGSLLSLLILYYVIKGAVKSANEPLRFQLRLQNNLKIQEMMNEGREEQVKKAMADTNQIKK
jgi:hypothetical protein